MSRTLALLTPAVLCGCFEPAQTPPTAAEMRAAADALSVSSRAAAFNAEVIHISTSFTMGQALEESLEELRDFYISQAPCSEVTVEDRRISIDFGAESEHGCEFRGRSWAGVQTLTLDQVSEDELVIEHDWVGLTDGFTTLDGGATVTWNWEDETREVTHAATWELQGREMEAEGDRLQRWLGDSEGIRVDGQRSWVLDGQLWELDIQDVQLRAADPLPRDGRYLLLSPAGREFTATFEVVDGDTIRMVLESGGTQKVVEVAAADE